MKYIWLKVPGKSSYLKVEVLSESEIKNEKIFIYLWALQVSDNIFIPKYVGQTCCGKERWKNERQRPKSCIHFLPDHPHLHETAEICGKRPNRDFKERRYLR